MAMMRASIAASVAASYNLAQQVRTAAASPAQGTDAAQQLATASAEARGAVTAFVHDMYERKIFEPYLHFTSKEDEDAYRKREAETKRAIEDALKLNTPEGNLRAAELSAAQLKDAGAHGADKSPDYAPLLQQTNAAKTALESALVRSEQPAVAHDERREAASSDAGLQAAKEKIDPAMLSAFSALVAHTGSAVPDGPGVVAQAKTGSSVQLPG